MKRGFSTPVHTGPRATQLLVQWLWYQGSRLQSLAGPAPTILCFWHFIWYMSSRNNFSVVRNRHEIAVFISSCPTKRKSWNEIWIIYDIMTHVNRVMYDYRKIKWYCIFFVRTYFNDQTRLTFVCGRFNMQAHLISATHIITVKLNFYNTVLYLIRNSYQILVYKKCCYWSGS